MLDHVPYCVANIMSSALLGTQPILGNTIAVWYWYFYMYMAYCCVDVWLIGVIIISWLVVHRISHMPSIEAKYHCLGPSLKQEKKSRVSSLNSSFLWKLSFLLLFFDVFLFHLIWYLVHIKVMILLKIHSDQPNADLLLTPPVGLRWKFRKNTIFFCLK